MCKVAYLLSFYISQHILPTIQYSSLYSCFHNTEVKTDANKVLMGPKPQIENYKRVK